MSATSAPPPTDRRAAVDRPALERLIGVRSSKPSFYAAWRDNSARLDHTIETLERISSALCAAPAGPVAVCDAVVEAAAHHFDARWAAMVFSAEDAGVGTARVFIHASEGVIQRWEVPPRMLAALTDQTLALKGPVLAERDEGLEFGGEPCVIVAAPMPVHGKLAGILVVGLAEGVEVAPSDVSILVTLANHAGVALHNASLFQENGRRASELERRGSELEGTLRRLEEAGRRQLLSRERNRIARELHDSVAQHLLTIGMNLEWCRRHDSTSPPVLERVTAAKSLARSAVDDIRAVIFELASDGRTDVRRALLDAIEEVIAGTPLQAGLRTYGSRRSLSETAQHALVQIAREALFNVVRHADASHAWLALRWFPDRVRLTVADDGTGDAHVLRRRLQAAAPEVPHFGLAGIAGRVRELGGTAAVGRRRGGGVSLRVEVPLHEVSDVD